MKQIKRNQQSNFSIHVTFAKLKIEMVCALHWTKSLFYNNIFSPLESQNRYIRFRSAPFRSLSKNVRRPWLI